MNKKKKYIIYTIDLISDLKDSKNYTRKKWIFFDDFIPFLLFLFLKDNYFLTRTFFHILTTTY